MSEAKDPAIKLFGKTIPLPDIPANGSLESTGAPSSSTGPVVVENMDQDHADHACSTNSSPEANTNGDGEEREADKDIMREKPTENNKQGDGGSPVSSEELKDPDATSGINENPETPCVEKESSTLKGSETEEEHSESCNSQEKPLKKPDKILPCPRCNSMDTKFCYYNNYNVNQPRHFCKNCQRYWTAGGTMRNVPVGAGRRKNKNSASQYRHITVSEALQNAQTDLPNGVHHPSLKSNGTVLTFGSDTPLCESMASVLNLADQTMRNCAQNRFHRPKELRVPVPYGGGENGEDCPNGASVATSNSKDGPKNGSQEQVMRNSQGFPPQIQCFTGTPWPYPWNSVQWSSPIPPPAFCPPGFPMLSYPAAAYWGCTVPAAWSIPWLPQPTSPTPSSGPNSPTLGKHSRDENVLKSSNCGDEEQLKESNGERCLWIPKTLRIDDPGEAAKSSIWATLGIKNDKVDSIRGGGLFKAFRSKTDEKHNVAEPSPVLQANPAALSRSLNFHESS